MRPFLVIILFLLSACAAQLPTSERLEQVRVAKQAALEKKLTNAGLSLGAPTFIRVFKSENLLETWLQNEETGRYALFKTYPICNYSGTLGPKLAEGDHQAPEGFYTVTASQMNPWSQYHLSFDLGFPNEYDRALGRTGSHLMIHGDCKSEGCYAVTDDAIEEIYLLTEASIREGHHVPIHAFPFRMTPRNMQHHASSHWISFWKNLKQGYAEFELTKIPPPIQVKNTENTFAYAVMKNASTRHLIY